jgi:hypothetical protein
MPSALETLEKPHRGVTNKQRIQCEVAVEALRTSGKLRLQVYGGSMLPFVWPGDILSIHRAAHADLQRGELVLFTREDGFVVHRVVAKSGDSLITRGDSLDSNDPPVSPNQVLGRVVAIERGGFRLSPPGGINCRQGFLLFLIRRCSPFKILMLRLCSLRLKLHRARNREEATA